MTLDMPISAQYGHYFHSPTQAVCSGLAADQTVL